MLRKFSSGGNESLDKVGKLLGMRSVRKLKVKSVLHRLDTHNFLMRSVLEDQLLEEVKGSFMIGFLSKLDHGTPRVRGVSLLAVVALHRMHDEVDNHVLLHQCPLGD